MSGGEIIARWATLLLAEVLNLSARAAETVLRSQPRWLAHLRLLEANLRAGAGTRTGEPQHPSKSESETPAPGSTGQLLESYAILNRSLKDIEARGLALDDALMERMQREWSPKSIVGYLQTCDAQLKQGIGKTLKAATAALDPVAAADASQGVQPQATKVGHQSPTNARCDPAVPGKPKSSPRRQKGLVT